MMNSITVPVAISAVAVAILLWPASSTLVKARLPYSSATEKPSTLVEAVMSSSWIIRGVAVLAIVAVLVTGVAETLAVAIAARTVLSVYRNIKKRRQATAEVAALSHALESVVGELKSGQTPAAALEIAHRDIVQRRSDQRIVDAVGQAAQSASFGASWPERTVHAMPQFSRMWQVAHEFGLPMAEMLDCYRGDLVARQSHQSKTSAALAGPRLTIAILASLPVFGLVLGQAFGAEPMAFLTSGGIGGIVLVVGIGLCCAGVVWAVQIMSRAEAVQ